MVLAALASVGVAQETQEEFERRNRVGVLLNELGAEPGTMIADVGAGPGLFTVPIARAVSPGGRTVAEDIDQAALDKVKTRAANAGIENVDVILGTPSDPHLAEAHFDAVLIHNAYHEMVAHEEMLDHVRTALKPGGHLVVAEPMHESSRGLSRDEQVAHHDIDIDIVDHELRNAGFEVLRRDPAFVIGQAGAFFWLIVARRPPR